VTGAGGKGEAVMKTTILGGVLFLAPLAVLAVILGKVFQIGRMVAEPLNEALPLRSLVGVAALDVLAVLRIVLFCFGAGLLARLALMRGRLQRLDDLLIDLVPTYAVFKTMLASASASDGFEARMTPVLVRFDDYEQIGFETDRDAERSVVFLPGAPSAWSGTTIVVEVARVRRLDLPTHQAVKLSRAFGRGTLAVRAGETDGKPMGSDQGLQKG
jgi:uncharacterized membrane protein